MTKFEHCDKTVLDSSLGRWDASSKNRPYLRPSLAIRSKMLKRYRSGGEQKVTVQHVHIADGGQAIVGNVSAPTEGGEARKKSEVQPMLLHMHQALRCRARSKRSGKPCRSPAVKGHSVCRMHGAGGGGPEGNRNALKHGTFTAETLAMKREISALARMARKTMGAIE